jgi:hypothetical protein
MLRRVVDEEECRRRLRALADAARLPVPRLVFEDREDDFAVAAVRGHGKRQHIVVDRSFAWLSADEQNWHLASALGWWATPVPRRLRRLGWLIAAVNAALATAVAVIELAGSPEPPSWIVVGALLMCGFVLPPAINWMALRGMRACDAAGHDILRAAGHQPAELARRVLGDQPDPPWHKRLFAPVPPSQRIAAAERHQLQPQRPLF